MMVEIRFRSINCLFIYMMFLGLPVDDTQVDVSDDEPLILQADQDLDNVA